MEDDNGQNKPTDLHLVGNTPEADESLKGELSFTALCPLHWKETTSFDTPVTRSYVLLVLPPQNRELDILV
jgi:hypothetical protein